MPESHSPRQWSVEVHHVLDHDRQQRILEAFRDIGRPDVTALGTRNGGHFFVVVETSTVEDKFSARTTITAIDPHATRAYTFKAPQVAGPMPA